MLLDGINSIVSKLKDPTWVIVLLRCRGIWHIYNATYKAWGDMSLSHCTVLVKSFAHLNGNFFLAFLEEIDKLWKGWTVYNGVL